MNKVTLAESQLKLKIGAEVMLLYNLSDKLKNGTRGKVIKLENDGPTIDFKDFGIVTKLHRCTWFAYKSGEKDTIVGQRSQFPLRLAWGITAHKAQGQTLSAAVVHSGNEFLPEQLYVACSRVSTKEGLQIVNFCPKKIIKEDFCVADIGIRATKFGGGRRLVCPTCGLDECRRGSPRAFSPAKILRCRVSQMPFPGF